MPSEPSDSVLMACGSGAQKLGQPVPLSNLVEEAKAAVSQPAQVKVPGRCSFSSGLEKGISVPASRSTSYCAGVRRACHSASVWVTRN